MIVDKVKSKVNLNTPEANAKRRYWLTFYLIAAVVFLAIYLLVSLKVFEIPREYLPVLSKASITFLIICVFLFIGKLVERYIVTRNQSVGHNYNLVRISHLVINLLVFVMLLSFLFQNWYTAAVSFGLLSLILGFALQTPISSFIGWLYIIFRTPYRVGERIELNGFKGDVIEINYLDTTLLEFSGNYLSNDRLSGRVIRFPNSMVLKSEVLNYSGPQAPFIWNETAIQIAYTSDLNFVAEVLCKAAKEDFEEHYLNVYTSIPLEPAVYFRTNAYAWMEAVVSYPVLPMETTPRRTRILTAALPILNAAPDKVKFPEGVAR